MQMPDFMSERTQDFVDFLKSKKPVAVVTLILIALTVCAVITMTVYSCANQKPRSKKLPVPVAEPFEPDQPIVLPSSPEIADGYALSRTPQTKWTQEEEEKWFTAPDTNNLEDLKKANDSMMSDVIGAAP